MSCYRRFQGFGQKRGQDSGASGVVRQMVVAGQQFRPRRRDYDQVVLTIDELFLFTLEDLEERAALGSGEYSALNMAWLLRKLLLDDPPLVHAVNRHRRHKLRFCVTDLTPDPDIDGWALNDVFHPDGKWPDHATVDLTWDQFLARTVLVAHGEHVSVHDLIDFLAHNYGAVHTSPARDAKTEALRDEAWGARMTSHAARPVFRSRLRTRCCRTSRTRRAQAT